MSTGMIGLLAGLAMISQIGTRPWRAMTMGRHRGHHGRSMFLGVRGRANAARNWSPGR